MNQSSLSERLSWTDHKRRIVVLFVAFLISAGLCMTADWLSTNIRPNPITYLMIPPIAWAGGALVVYLLSRIIRQPLGFFRTFGIVFASGIFLQALEPLEKTLYHFLPAQAAFLYLIFNLPLSVAIYAYVLHRWGPYHWAAAIFLALANGVAILAVGGVLTAFLGT